MCLSFPVARRTMPFFEENPEFKRKIGDKLTPEEVIFECASYGWAFKKMERCIKANPNVNVNWKNLVGETALHRAAFCGSEQMVARLLELKADPNVPATQNYVTPLDYIQARIDWAEESEERLGDWDTVKKLPNYMVHIVPKLDGFYASKKVLKEAGGISGQFVPPDGFVHGKGESEIRAYTPGPEGSYTTADIERSGRFIKVTEEMLKEREEKAKKEKKERSKAKAKAKAQGKGKP